MKRLTSALILPIAALLLIGLVAFSHWRYEAISKVDATEAAAVIEQTEPHKVMPIERWAIETNTNEMDGKKEISLNNGHLFLRCAPEVAGYIDPPLHNLGGMLETSASDHGQTVRYKLDDGKIHRERWWVSDSLDALFMPRTVLQKLSHSQNLILEYEPQYVTPQTTTISLEGLAEAETKAGCKL